MTFFLDISFKTSIVFNILDLLHTSLFPRHPVCSEPVEKRISTVKRALRQAQGERRRLLQEVLF